MNAIVPLTNDDLSSAFRNKQIVPLFQPVISIEQLAPQAAELSLVWHHPILGQLAPSLFLPFADAQGRTRELTLYALRAAAEAAVNWRRQGLMCTLTVNIPTSELSDGTLPASIHLLLNEFELPAEAFTIEIEEASLAGKAGAILPTLTEIRAMGCGVALDGGATLPLIQDLSALPLTEIKIAGGAAIRFVRHTRHARRGTLFQRLARAAEAHIQLTAVSVGDEDTLWSLQRIGFQAAQGRYICQPLPAEEIVGWSRIWHQAAQQIAQSKRDAAPQIDDRVGYVTPAEPELVPEATDAVVAQPVASEEGVDDQGGVIDDEVREAVGHEFEPLPTTRAPAPSLSDNASVALPPEPHAEPTTDMPEVIDEDTADDAAGEVDDSDAVAEVVAAGAPDAEVAAWAKAWLDRTPKSPARHDAAPTDERVEPASTTCVAGGGEITEPSSEDIHAENALEPSAPASHEAETEVHDGARERFPKSGNRFSDKKRVKIKESGAVPDSVKSETALEDDAPETSAGAEDAGPPIDDDASSLASIQPDFAGQADEVRGEQTEATDQVTEPLAVAERETRALPQAGLARAATSDEAVPSDHKTTRKAPQETTLIERRLPGLDRPIVMTVQNEGSNRLNFIRRLNRRTGS